MKGIQRTNKRHYKALKSGAYKKRSGGTAFRTLADKYNDLPTSSNVPPPPKKRIITIKHVQDE
jgi:hypothetical protein